MKMVVYQMEMHVAIAQMTICIHLQLWLVDQELVSVTCLKTGTNEGMEIWPHDVLKDGRTLDLRLVVQAKLN